MMDQTTKDKLETNIINSWKMLSVQFWAAATLLGSLYAAMPAEMQQSILSHLPVPPWTLLPISFAIGYFLRVKPQKNITPEVAAAKSEDASQPPPP